MMKHLCTFMRLASDVDWEAKWEAGTREMSLQDLRTFAIFITLVLCVLALAVAMLVVAIILEKKNDYGDEDELHMRKAEAFAGSVDARMSTDIASGAVNCMKHFQYQDVSKR